MRSGSDAVRGGMTVALVALVLAWGIGTASGQPRAIGDPEIARALEAVKSDGLIAPERTFKTLKWRASE